VAEAVPLIPEQRQQRLLQLLRAQGVVSIRTLTDELGVSHMTVRRDIAALEADGQVVSVQGGVRLAGSSGMRPPTSRDARQVLELPRKQAIAEQAAGLVDDGMTVFLDAGTTCQAVVPFLVGRRDLTVVTNDFHVVTALFQQPDIETIHTGGLVDVESGSSTGRLAAATLSGIALDLALLSTGAWSVARGVTAAAQDQVTLKLAAIAAATTCAVVADSTKFGASSRYRVAELERFDVVVTDEDLPEDGRRAVAELGVDVRLAAVPAS
jgi:DeoR/GlpR family transcriptional regulator of sugar metabolism